MCKNAMKCNKTQSKWYINKHGASKIIDMFETYQGTPWMCLWLEGIVDGWAMEAADGEREKEEYRSNYLMALSSLNRPGDASIGRPSAPADQSTGDTSRSTTGHQNQRAYSSLEISMLLHIVCLTYSTSNNIGWLEEGGLVTLW
jgi:hypothetical protein